MATKREKQIPFFSPYAGKIVSPGDVVIELNNGGKVLRLGGGLLQEGNQVVVYRAGKLQSTKGNKFWVDSPQKRYMPSSDDVVIGIVTDRRSEHFDVDIGGPSLSRLPILAFEGATRRNIPKLQVGSLIYARISKTHPDAEPELSCMDASGSSAGFGLLNDGYMFDCNILLCKALLRQPTLPILSALGKSMSYELAIGLNGRVWVNSPSPSSTILVSNAILNSEFLSPGQQVLLARKLIENHS